MKHTPKKNFGQNFLTDYSVIESIIKLSNFKKNDCIIEIGPGKGALTDWLTKTELKLKVFAIELDKTLVPILKKKYSQSQFKVVQADILTFDLENACSVFFGNCAWRIIGNLPYNISSPILFKLLNINNKVRDQFFTLQNEVVDRMVAKPGSRIYGRLSVMLQAAYTIEKLLVIDPKSFYPVPKVTSAFVKMSPNKVLFSTIKDWNVLSNLVTASFSSRRKTIKNNLKEFLYQLDFDILEAELTDRAEDISVRDYICLANQISAKMN